MTDTWTHKWGLTTMSYKSGNNFLPNVCFMHDEPVDWTDKKIKKKLIADNKSSDLVVFVFVNCFISSWHTSKLLNIICCVFGELLYNNQIIATLVSDPTLWPVFRKEMLRHISDSPSNTKEVQSWLRSFSLHPIIGI